MCLTAHNKKILAVAPKADPEEQERKKQMQAYISINEEEILEKIQRIKRKIRELENEICGLTITPVIKAEAVAANDDGRKVTETQLFRKES